MSTAQATIYLGGNNLSLNEELNHCLKKVNLNVEKKSAKETDYRLLIYDLSPNVEKPIEAILNELDAIANYSGKTCVVLVCPSQQDDRQLDQYQSTVQSYLDNPRNNLRLIITKDLYHEGKENITEFENQLCQTVTTGKIEVSSSGVEKHYPTSLEDLSEIIIKSLFVTGTSGQNFVALTEEISDLELGYLLKKVLERTDIKLDINLNNKSKKETTSLMESAIRTQALLNWIPQKNFSDSLPSIIDRCLAKAPSIDIPYEPKVEPSPKIPLLQKLPQIKIEKRKTKTIQFGPKISLRKIISVWLIMVVIIALAPLVLSLGSLYFSTKLTYQAFQEIRRGQISQSTNHLKRAQSLQSISAVFFQPLVPVANLFAKNDVASVNNYLLVLSHGQSLLNSIIDTYTLGNKLYLGILGRESIDSKTISAATRVNLVSISERLSQVQLLLSQIKLPYGYSDRLNNTDVNQSINLLKSQISFALPLLDLVEKVSTNQTLQRYLVVVQDINELRPTGGFIGTYGVLTFDQGKIIDFQVDSSLALDRLIEGKIEPPSVVKQLLGQQNWSFHDSNLDADFPNSAKQIAWFYQRFKNNSLDGVIGLNTNLFLFLLEQIDPITLPDGQSVNRDNLLSLTSNPTASRGLDVLTALTQALAKKFLAGDIPFAGISRATLKAVAFGEINLWFSSPALEVLSEASNLDGSVAPGICHPQLSAINCRADTIYLNESNMSVNKLNYYLKRNQNLEAEITSSGQVSYTVNFDYSFPVPAPTDLGNLYKVYYQLYLPASSQDIAISLDNQSLDPKSLVQTNSAGLTKLEFSASLSLNQPHRLNIRFVSPNYLDFKKQLVPFTLVTLKQPGTINDSLTVKVRYPANLLARNMTTPLKQTGANELIFQTNQVSRESLGIIFKNQAL